MLSKLGLIMFLVVCGNMDVGKCEYYTITESTTPDTTTTDSNPYTRSDLYPATTEMYCPRTPDYPSPTCSSGMTISGNCMKCNSCLNETDVVIKAFLNYAVVPQIIPRPPTGILRAKTPPNYDIVPGDVVPAFSFSLGLSQASWAADPGALYTMFYMNADINYILYGTYRLINLSLVIVNIPGDNWPAGDLILGYRPHLPIPGYGPERYVGLVYKQPKRMVVTQNLTRSFTTTDKYDLRNFIETNNLGDPLFGNLALAWLLFNVTNQNYSY